MNLFDLVATLRLDTEEYEEGIKKSSGMLGGIGNAFGKIAKVGAVALGASATAVGVLTKQSVDAYANYEQLAGGVKKLYQTASDELMEYANNAYKTSGMSANQYMEQATSFSAALVNSLDGDFSAAAKQTDVAMRAISDNFNTFGGDIGMISGAFQGFAKQNYTMLDNLKLGYGGTKSEMERLIADANEYAESIGQASDLSIDSFSDIVTAIDLVQQKQGIAGTTTKEAATTIEGALNMTKSAWENLVTGLTNPDADIGSLVDNLVVAIVGEKEGEGLLNQIIPAIQRALDGVGQLLEKSAPIISQYFPKLVSQILPPLLKSATSLVTGLVSALPALVRTLADQAPYIITALVVGISDALPLLLDSAPQIIATLVTGLVNAIPDLVPVAVKMVTQLVQFLTDNIPFVVNAGIALLKALGQGLINAIPILLQSIPTIIGSLVSGLFDAGSMLLSTGGQLIGKLMDGIWNATDWFMSQVISFASQIPSAIMSALTGLYDIGANIVSGIWNGISGSLRWLKNLISGWVGNVKSFLKTLFGISSPSKWARDIIGSNIVKGLALGIENGEDTVQSAFDSILPDYDGDYTTRLDKPVGSAGGVSIVNYITVDGAENPEEFTDRFVRRLRLDMRTI